MQPEAEGELSLGTKLAEARHGDLPPRELRCAAASCGSSIARARPVSDLDVPRHRGAAYHLELADGRSVKGRLLRDEAAAERVSYILSQVPHPAFPRLLARQGRALILEWIEGDVVSDRTPGAACVEAAADLLVALHAADVPDDCPFASPDPLARARAASDRHLGRLGDAGALTPREAERLRGLLRDLAPDDSDHSFVHGDLCGENLVVDGSGRLRAIDNEGLGVDSPALDLARSLYRWPLAPAAADALLDRYEDGRPGTRVLADFGFWGLVARLGSAAHRVGGPAAVASLPLRSLEQLLAGLEAGFSGRALVHATSSPARGEPARAQPRPRADALVRPGGPLVQS